MPKHLQLVILLLVSVVAPLSAAAQQQRSPVPDNIEIVASIWCDTAEQLETVLRAHHTHKVPMSSAMAEINKDNPEACIFARAIVSAGPEVKRLTAGDAVMSLRAAEVHGIMRGQYALMMRPQTWYFMRVVAELVPL
jgi:hypothetical protein